MNFLQCIKLGKHLDMVKSLKIEKIKDKKPIAYWKGITASSPQTFTYNVGIGDIQNKQDKSSSANKLQDALETGFKTNSTTEVTESKFGMKTREETRAMEDLSSTQASHQNMTITTKCSIEASADEIAKDKTKGGVGLWQYVIATEDYSAAAFTPHTICRRGKLAFTPPKCPYYACLDDQCEKCLEVKEEVIKQGKDEADKFREDDDKSAILMDIPVPVIS